MNELSQILSFPPVWMWTAPNPGPKTLSGTNVYLVGLYRAYLIDPGPDLRDFQRKLVDDVDSLGATVKGILLTHRHPDHAPGARELSAYWSVPVWAADAPILDPI